MLRLLMMSTLIGSAALIGCEDRSNDDTTPATNDSVLNNDAPGDPDVTAPPTTENASQTTTYESLVARYNRVSDEFGDFTTWFDRAGDNVSEDLTDLRDRVEDRLEQVRNRLEGMRDNAGSMTDEARNDITAALDELQDSIRRGLDRVRGTMPNVPNAPSLPSVPQ